MAEPKIVALGQETEWVNSYNPGARTGCQMVAWAAEGLRFES